MSSSLPKSGPAAPGRSSRTPELDAALLASFQKDPQRFQRATRRELLVAILLFALGVLIAWLGAFVITDRQGGLTLLSVAAFPILLGLTVVDSLRFRWRLEARVGTSRPAADA